MQIKKQFKRGNLAWCLKHGTADKTDLDEINAQVEVEVLNKDKLEYPVQFGVRSEDDYANFDKKKVKAENKSGLKETFEFDITESGGSNRENKDGDDESHSKVWFSGSGESGEDHLCNFVPKEVATLCIGILDQNVSDEKLMERLSKYYNIEPQPVVFAGLNQDAKYCTDFQDHIKILDFLYKKTEITEQDPFDVRESISNFIRKRVIKAKSKNKAYPVESRSELENRIEACSDKHNLPQISNKNELIGLYFIKQTDELVNKGEFDEAKGKISKAINSFERDDSDKAHPAKIKKSALIGLQEEKNRNFAEAAKKYSDAAADAVNEQNRTAYNAWSKVAEAKQRLDNGNIESAKQIIDKIEYSHDKIHLIDLKKIAILFDLYATYIENKESDPNEIFNKVDFDRETLPSTDAIIQYNTDYSAAFTMLITKQRHRQLGIDSGLNDDSLTIIKDAITPTGISKSESKDGDTGNGNTKQKSSTNSDTDFERNYTETKRAQRDNQFQEKIKEAYNQSCAVCGSQRRTPDGRPEVEAAHIRPVSKDGRDTITNGIALCKLHHWAFDNGWISINNDYSIIVLEAPEVAGYDDFIKYQDKQIDLPESQDKLPDKQNLKFHRQEHNLESE